MLQGHIALITCRAWQLLTEFEFMSCGCLSFNHSDIFPHFFISEQLPDKTRHLPEPWYRAEAARETERHHQKTSGLFVVLLKVSFLQTENFLRFKSDSKNDLYIISLAGLSQLKCEVHMLIGVNLSVAGLSNWRQGLQLPCCRPHSHEPGGGWGFQTSCLSTAYCFYCEFCCTDLCADFFFSVWSRGVGASRDEER